MFPKSVPGTGVKKHICHLPSERLALWLLVVSRVNWWRNFTEVLFAQQLQNVTCAIPSAPARQVWHQQRQAERGEGEDTPGG